jgi:hypothetical protein
LNDTFTTTCSQRSRRTLAEIVQSRGKLPPVLFLQFDNCWRENKNWVMFAFLSWLVEERVVRRINVGFLIVG